jgi:hypothetical protein
LIEVIWKSRSGRNNGVGEVIKMSESKNMEYYQGRALHERELARTSADASVARIHIEMAEHYEKIVGAAQMETSAANAQTARR